MKNRHNILLSIYKLLFALIVLCHHDFTPLTGRYFFSPNSTYAVCFFFMCVGYYMYDNMKRFIAENGKMPALKYTVRRVRKLGIPLYICVAFTFIIYIADFGNIRGILHYLWFVAFLVCFEFGAVILIRYLSKKQFTLIMFIMFCVAGTLMVLEWIGVLDSLPSEIMGFITIPLGFFVSFLKDRLKAAALFTVLLIIATPATLYASLFSRNEAFSFVIVFLFIPVIFISIVGLNLETDRVLLNSLISKLSLWLYIFQEIPRSLCEIYDLSHMRGFHIILILVLFCTVLYLADYYDKKYKAAILNG